MTDNTATANVDRTDNLLLHESTLDYQLPDFTQLKPEHALPAIRAGIDEAHAQIQAIVQNPAPATFANTFEALEQSGRTLSRASTYLYALSSALGTAEFKDAQLEAAPLLAQFNSDLLLNAELYARLKAAAQVPSIQDLTEEQARLIELTLRDFELAGIGQEAQVQEQLRDIDAKLAQLESEFGQLVTKDRQDAALVVERQEQLDGLSPAEVETARLAAVEAGFAGSYLISLLSPTSQPMLSVLTDPNTRAQLMSHSLERGVEREGRRTLDIAAEMAQLRAQRAALLGYANHAELSNAVQTAPNLEAVTTMLTELVPAALANVESEKQEMGKLAAAKIEAADWQFYSDKVKAQKYAIDSDALRPYFELNAVIEQGVFYAANRLYGLTFQERTDLHGYHPDVRVWEVFDSKGQGIGLFLGDYYARPTKNGGAWMNNLVEQSHFLGLKPVVMNNLNITKPAEGELTLLTLDEVNTAFHEFGHALHGLLSDVNYARLQGTNVPRDFVEYPSQVNEMWALWPEVLANYAKHSETGEQLDPQIGRRLNEAAIWGEGFATTEYLKAALLDLAWHQLTASEVPTSAEAAEEFERETLAKLGLGTELVPPRYRSAYFAHIFAGGYSAGYYSYIWSEILDADTVEWFKENGGLSRENGTKMREELLSRGNSRDPLTSFESLRGRPASIEPLLRRRGLASN